MKSKHYTNIIMDDIVKVTAKDAKDAKYVEALEKWINNGMRKQLFLPRGHAKSYFWGHFSLPWEYFESSGVRKVKRALEKIKKCYEK